MHVIIMDFSIWRHLTRPRGPLRAQGSALTRNVERFKSELCYSLADRGLVYFLPMYDSTCMWFSSSLQCVFIARLRDFTQYAAVVQAKCGSGVAYRRI